MAAKQDANDLVHRGVRIAESIASKLSSFERDPVSTREVILGTAHERLRSLPVEELDSLSAAIKQHLKKHGCSTERAFGDTYALSDVAEQLRSAAEQVAPYRPYLAKLKEQQS